ncbi:Vault protein inter-alpha-trypsin [Coleofasciculus chthonoplastes PCC 7420]|uniref:Vault protein inter-alpha-trypsin n=1 Tax=Coleofasciculus chthonoplastes PCC 7420 TaxID=118168 RepID=B4VWG4_9CYAN|nr:VIT domain-containing protein [Coleofasciculus chthonoplastes]EDX73627.1 Vault protein inter-alpha-trypsin [Coleofasciculus chthonoplastes PCC 7420]
MKFVEAIPITLCLSGIFVVVPITLAQVPAKIPTRVISQTLANNQQELPVGGLYVQSEEGQQQVFPLKHTEVNAKVTGNVSQVEVTQTFENPFAEPLEAVYVFPLPDEAAVYDMEIKIGDRTIKGEIKKSEEAQAIYEQARQEGRTAGLLEQERANIFTQSLANIKPGEQIDVTIRYTDSLKFQGGDYEFVFPMVVGPRYIPGTPMDNSGNTNQVPDASRITPPVLKPGTRSGHDINVTVEINAGVPIQDVRSPSHQIRTQRRGETVQVQLGGEDTIPNKDLILRYQVAGDRTQATILSQTDERGGHFALYLIPALDYRPDEIVPKDVVFLMDTSGSQRGEPFLKSQELMRRFINGLNPDDTFTIIDFANTTTQLSPQPLANTAPNRTQALNYINGLQANGGTELMNGIRAVLNFPPSAPNRLRSVVLLTDGYIGNESQVIAEVQRQLKPGNRLYSFGVGSSVNRFLLNRLAEVGRGTAKIIRQDEPTQEVAETFARQINNPVLTDIRVSWQGEGTSAQIYPLAAPDLFANQPLVLLGRKPDRRNGTIKITGMTAGSQRYEKTLSVNFDQSSDNPAIAQLWGRARIKDLMNQMFGGETTSGVEAVTQTALNYNLLSQYTAFVAVSEEVRVEPDGTRRRVQVPVELPEGVSYEGIFGTDDVMNMSGTANFAPAPSGMIPLSRQAGGTRGGGEILLESDSVDVTSQGSPQLTVVKIEGLEPEQEENAIASLTQHLQSLNLPEGFTGEIIFEVQIRDGAVQRVILDDIESTLQDTTIVDPIRRSLLGWSTLESVTGRIRVTLRVP